VTTLDAHTIAFVKHSWAAILKAAIEESGVKMNKCECLKPHNVGGEMCPKCSAESEAERDCAPTGEVKRYSDEAKEALRVIQLIAPIHPRFSKKSAAEFLEKFIADYIAKCQELDKANEKLECVFGLAKASQDIAACEVCSQIEEELKR
jgi:hypothetical protein